MLMHWREKKGRGFFKMGGNSKPRIVETINWKFVTQEIKTYSENCQASSMDFKRK